MRIDSHEVRAVPMALVALAIGTASPSGWAGEEIPFDEAHLFFELNHSDGDLGIHALVDGEPWKKFQIEDPSGARMLDINVTTRLQKQGLTEIFFESAEPPFESDEDEETLTPEDFFKRFPEGMYALAGETLEGDDMASETRVTHAMPAPPQPSANGKSSGEECDPAEDDYDAPKVSAPVTIAWPAVKMSHPDLGVMPPIAVTIHNYELAVEILDAAGVALKLSLMLPPDLTSVAIPAEVLAAGKKFKYEVLAREESFNQTGVEGCFQL